MPNDESKKPSGSTARTTTVDAISKFTFTTRAVDFWLGKKDEHGFPILEALLEVSGILKENRGNTVNARLQQKKLQVKQSAYRNLPVYVVVVEFSQPKAKMEQL